MPSAANEEVYAASEKASPVPISIFGSCVSRDALEFARPGAIRLETYIARQCISSAVARPILIEEEEIPLKSRFQRRMVYYDLAKKTFLLLEEDKSRFLLLDLIDERFPPVSYQDSLITLSNELVASKMTGEAELASRREIKAGWFSKKKRYYVENRLLTEDIKSFCERLLKCYPPQSVILHRARMSDYYRSSERALVRFPKNYLNYNARMNQLLDFMYDEMEKQLPGCHVMAISGDFCADETHKWGLSPMHYQKEYYEEAAKRIERIILGKE